MNDRDYGPALGGGARRDPRLSIRREPSPRPPHPLDPTRRKMSISSGWIARNIGGGVLILFALVLTAFTAAILALIATGLLLHGAWDAIMVGWNLI